jgi:hypothetical protein
MITASQPYLSPTRCVAAERASPAALAQFQRQVREQDIPYWGPNCVVRVLDWADRGCPSGPPIPCVIPGSHLGSTCCSQLNSLTPETISLKTAAIYPTSSILPPQKKVIPPVTRSCLLPHLWPSCSQATATRPRPPPQPSHSLPAGTTTVATTPATLTPPGSTTGKATGQAIGCHQTATLTGPATARATLTPLGLIPGRATGPSGKAKEAAQASTISRRTMARSLKAVAAAAQAAKDRQFRAFQEELGLYLDNDGEASAPSTPQKAATQRPVA